jgi:nucleoside-diphosphate-sugar epimerase
LEEKLMKIFITGGTGNIGQYISKALHERGHELIILSRNPDRVKSLRDMNDVTVVKGTLLDFDTMEKCIEGCDAVIHIALGWGNEPVAMLNNDTRATVFLAEAAERAGVKNFIYTSSTAAMGPLRENMDETFMCLPSDLYGATKASSEMYLLGFRQYYSAQGEYGIPVKLHRNIIRPGYTFSNPAWKDGSSESDIRFKNICRSVINNKPIVLTKYDGTQFLSAGQIAEIYVKLVESNMNEEIFLALGATFTTWEDIAKMALELTPESSSQIIIQEDGRDPKISYYCVDKINRVFGLKFDAKEELREHVRWDLEQIKTCKYS